MFSVSPSALLHCVRSFSRHNNERSRSVRRR